jgi:broad specificity phosphatase PhoE
MVRHALAPGIGDPDEFQLHDCNTQRNLNEEGRQQARAMGKWLRQHGIQDTKIYSSQWCRCLDTARLMQMGEVTPLPALNSFYEKPEDREPNITALREFLYQQDPRGPLVILVTHQVTVAEISGRYTAPGEGMLLTMENGMVRVLGKLGFQ